MKYISTRGMASELSASEAILKGLADDGGLYVPSSFPVLDKPLNELCKLNYQELAFEILKLFLTDYTDSELKDCIYKAYDEKFDTPLIAPLTCAGDVYFLELFHGKTIAFKDMALSILPHLLKLAAQKNQLNKEIVILTATSGDTGKAALEGFADVDGTKIIVFYPQLGVSEIQKRQMVTQIGKNTFVVAVKGNFDDAQSAVKEIFADLELNKLLNDKGYILSSANSINIGRLAPQIVYYFFAYSQLVQKNDIKIGDKINFCVPTGNFGNILAGYYAKKIGLPINKLICASNDNKVLYDFFQTGKYDRNREFYLTESPSMDILISSNLERLIYHLSNKSTTRQLMTDLANAGIYTFDISSNVDFLGQYANENEASCVLKQLFDDFGYCIDTHTAVAYAAYKKDKNNNDLKTVVISTASPYKFTKAVVKAIDKDYLYNNPNADEFELMKTLSDLSKQPIPKPIFGLDKRDILHKTVCEKNETKKILKQYLNI